MDALNASDAKREFGDVLLKAQKSPVRINKNGKPVAVVLSMTDYENLEACREYYLKQAIQEGMADIKAGRVSEGQAVFDRMHSRLR